MSAINFKVTWSYILRKLSGLLEWTKEIIGAPFFQEYTEIYIFLLKQAKLKLIQSSGGEDDTKEEKQVLELEVILTQNKSV